MTTFAVMFGARSAEEDEKERAKSWDTRGDYYYIHFDSAKFSQLSPFRETDLAFLLLHHHLL